MFRYQVIAVACYTNSLLVLAHSGVVCLAGFALSSELSKLIHSGIIWKLFA